MIILGENIFIPLNIFCGIILGKCWLSEKNPGVCQKIGFKFLFPYGGTSGKTLSLGLSFFLPIRNNKVTCFLVSVNDQLFIKYIFVQGLNFLLE